MIGGVQITDGLFRVDGTRVGNAYLMVVDDGLLLVDAGMVRSARRIVRFIEQLGWKPSDLHDVVITHCDLDHVGAAADLKRRTGARVSIHELDAGVLSGQQRPQKGGRMVVALFRLFRFRPVVADRQLRDGDTVGGLRVMHVPGHTAGSIALVRDDGVVFSGDGLLTDSKGTIKPPDPKLALDPAQASASAELIRTSCSRLLLPGHGSPAWV